MSQTYYAILTAIGEAKLANAAALGTTLQLTQMAVGDGGGATPQPSRTQTSLAGEKRRGPLNRLSIDPANASQIIAEHIIPEDVGGWWIRELGLYDAAGDLCAVANCPDTYKPVLASGSGRIQTIRMVLIVANTNAVQLKIDPSVVLAPRGYVDQVMVDHLAAQDPHTQYTTDEEVSALISAMNVSQSATAFTSSGSGSAYTLTPVPALEMLAANTRYRVKFHVANNGAASKLAVSGLAAKSIKQLDSFGNKVTPVIVSGQLADLEYDGVDFVILDPLPTVIRQIQSITAGVPSGGALPISYNGGTLDFRNGTQTIGAPILGVVVPSNNITLPSGATLGLIANQQGRIVFLEAYNGGSPVLCVANLAGGLLLDETNLISPTTISATATAANVIYSASAVSANSPYRVVGFMDITQAVAGTWVAPTLVQGCGGQALAALSSLGYGQTWQNVTRAAGTTYYNTTGRPIILNVSSSHGSINSYTVCTINGVAVYGFGDLGSTGACPYAWVIPAGASYMLSASSGTLIIGSCQELR